MAWTDGNVNGVENNRTVTVNGVARVNDIKFVNNVNGGNLLIIRGGSLSGSPQIVYTSVDPSSSIGNGDIVYEDASLNSPFDGDDIFFWASPACDSPAFTAFADIDNDGELSNRQCVPV